MITNRTEPTDHQQPTDHTPPAWHAATALRTAGHHVHYVTHGQTICLGPCGTYELLR
ncbi:hypothetical protein [Streptomyces albipurpureus]|uniref:Uncharacterized protein n=1 Tax=Streptomyces albipurpureus TaxID=2897419 RepID=A0ABT0UNI3_9ACTN|nr:hypothetical protein [Streptomyces sp. CWNU-1]MCM2390172.1 hypothetical protein [Streptomyces sp. CWNU-1]